MESDNAEQVRGRRPARDDVRKDMQNDQSLQRWGMKNKKGNARLGKAWCGVVGLGKVR